MKGKVSEPVLFLLYT